METDAFAAIHRELLAFLRVNLMNDRQEFLIDQHTYALIDGQLLMKGERASEQAHVEEEKTATAKATATTTAASQNPNPESDSQCFLSQEKPKGDDRTPEVEKDQATSAHTQCSDSDDDWISYQPR